MNETQREAWENGISDAGDVVFAVLDRLRCSVYDMEELTNQSTEREQQLLAMIHERYVELIWEKRDALESWDK
jgi:hypothetical protein